MKQKTRISYKVKDDSNSRHLLGINSIVISNDHIFTAGRDSLIFKWNISDKSLQDKYEYKYETNQDTDEYKDVNPQDKYEYHTDWVNDIKIYKEKCKY
jgi:hypothetical protein